LEEGHQKDTEPPSCAPGAPKCDEGNKTVRIRERERIWKDVGELDRLFLWRDLHELLEWNSSLGHINANVRCVWALLERG
jgi:hypothetical protein